MKIDNPQSPLATAPLGKGAWILSSQIIINCHCEAFMPWQSQLIKLVSRSFGAEIKTF